MEEGYTIRDQTLPHFITATVVDWIDVFTRKGYRDEVIKCFASHYIYSSASNYVNDNGLIEIEKADNPIVDVMNLNNLQRYDLY